MRLTLRSALAILLVLLLASFALGQDLAIRGASTTATRSLYLPWAIRRSKSA